MSNKMKKKMKEFAHFLEETNIFRKNFQVFLLIFALQLFI